MSRTTEKRPEESATSAPDSESALRRWSRRKHEARAGTKRTPKAVEPAEAPAVEARGTVPAKVLTDADMPPIETLDEHSDYTAFMSAGVSDTLRQAALRRLFQSPALNQLCELEGEFFDARGFEPLGNVVTHEMRTALERQLEKEASEVKKKVSDVIGEPRKSARVSDVTAARSDPSGGTERVPGTEDAESTDGAMHDRDDA